MYLPRHFEETRVDELHRLIREHPLGALVRTGPDGLDADHLPFELDASVGAQGVLRAHVARANPLWRQAAEGGPVLVVFRAGDAYVSPNWYPSKQEHHRAVPTWNYRVVHVHGRLRVRDDPRFLRGLVARLTRIHEAATGDPAPWRMTDAPRDFIDQMLASIVGLEIEIERLVGKLKLSQNREDRDRLAVARQLQDRDEGELAEAMRQALPPQP